VFAKLLRFCVELTCFAPPVEQIAPAFGESPEVGRGNPNQRCSVEIIGRVACAHVQPATVKAHAPVR
jgi:hypothetical protein